MCRIVQYSISKCICSCVSIVKNAPQIIIYCNYSVRAKENFEHKKLHRMYHLIFNRNIYCIYKRRVACMHMMLIVESIQTQAFERNKEVNKLERTCHLLASYPTTKASTVNYSQHLKYSIDYKNDRLRKWRVNKYSNLLPMHIRMCTW